MFKLLKRKGNGWGDSPDMNPDAKSRVEEAVPQPDATKRLTEDEKRALELSGEVEHAHGTQREEIAEEADEKAGGEANPK